MVLGRVLNMAISKVKDIATFKMQPKVLVLERGLKKVAIDQKIVL